MSSEFRTRALLAAQQALLREIMPQMRAVEVEWTSAGIVLRVFTQGEVSEDTRADFHASAVTQLLASLTDLAPLPQIDLEFVRCDAPARIGVRGTLVFARAGVGADAAPPTT